MLTVGVLLVALYLAWAVLMTWAHPRLIYPFFADRTELAGFKQITEVMPDGTEVAVQVSAGEGPTILYFMGNAGALNAFGPSLVRHQAAGRRIVALEYRGGAGRPGRPTEVALKADALFAADHALAYGDPVVVHGYSLGTGLAIHVAARRDVLGAVLEAPYSRLCELMARAAYLPACVMPFVQRWDTLADARDVSAPVIMLHGRQDRLIPIERGDALAAALTGAQRMIVDGADHQTIGLAAGAWNRIEDFLSDLHP